MICNMHSCVGVSGMKLVYKIPYRRAPRLAYRLHRPSASREQRYLAYKNEASADF